MRSFVNHAIVLAAAVGALLFGAPASATRMYADFTGAVAQSNRSGTTVDATDFWDLGAGLVGASFTARFLYDTDLGLAFTDALSDVRSGGPDWSDPVSPILSASLTIGDVTDTFDVARNGSANVTNNADGWRQTFLYTDFFPPGSPIGNALQLYVLNSPSILNPRLNQPYTGANLPGILGPTTDPFAQNIDGVNDYFLALATDTVTLSFAPIPEPGTWALMIGGLLLAGGALRRRAPALATAA